MKIPKVIQSAARSKAEGGKASVPVALGAAAIAGIAVAVIVFKFLRS